MTSDISFFLLSPAKGGGQGVGVVVGSGVDDSMATSLQEGGRTGEPTPKSLQGRP
jgi:hypothetical protein